MTAREHQKPMRNSHLNIKPKKDVFCFLVLLRFTGVFFFLFAMGSFTRTAKEKLHYFILHNVLYGGINRPKIIRKSR